MNKWCHGQYMHWRAIYCLSKWIDIHSLNDSKDPKTLTALATMHIKRDSTACCGEEESPTLYTYLLGVHDETQTLNSVRTVAQLLSNSDLTVIDR